MSSNDGVKKILRGGMWMPLFLLVWAFYIFYPISFSGGGISADGVDITKNFVLDGSPGWQATWAALFSVLMAAGSPVSGNFAVAGMVISKIMTILLPLAVYLLANALFNSRVGIPPYSQHSILTLPLISGSLEPEVTLLPFFKYEQFVNFNSKALGGSMHLS